MKLKPAVVQGSVRTVRRFALFPVTLTNGNRIWLEMYNVKQIYAYSIYHGFGWYDRFRTVK